LIVERHPGDEAAMAMGLQREVHHPVFPYLAIQPYDRGMPYQSFEIDPVTGLPNHDGGEPSRPLSDLERFLLETEVEPGDD
jgi:hypothetical protein